jgi:hypothetical protein
MREQIREAQGRLREAAASADYVRARRALEDLRVAFEEAVGSPEADEDALAEALREIEQARRLILAARAHDAARLARMKKPPAEYGNVGAASPSIRLEA